jgi:hypothetical protein
VTGRSSDISADHSSIGSGDHNSVGSEIRIQRAIVRSKYSARRFHDRARFGDWHADQLVQPVPRSRLLDKPPHPRATIVRVHGLARIVGVHTGTVARSMARSVRSEFGAYRGVTVANGAQCPRRSVLLSAPWGEDQSVDTADADPGWYAVRCVFAVESGPPRTYEERITLWQAHSAAAATALAEDDAHGYADTIEATYLGLAQCYSCPDLPGHGAEVFSLMRDSDLGRVDYLDQFFDTRAERQGHAD